MFANSSPGNIARDAARVSAAALKRLNDGLHYDFCPSWNRWVYWLKKPATAAILAIAISAACGLFLNPAALWLTGILVAVFGIGLVTPWLAVRGVDLHLSFDVQRSRVGEPTPIRLRVRNRWPWPVWGLSMVRGFSRTDDANSSEGVSLSRVPGWSSMEYSWRFTAKSRGRYPLVAPEVETGFPFGLYRATRRATVDGQVIVWPRTVQLTGLPDAVASRDSEEQLADRRTGHFGDLLGTRPFREGDSLRRVHWAQTARQQTLIVCERQAPATAVVCVTLDLDPASHQIRQERFESPVSMPIDSVETAVEVAASICESLHRQHCRVDLRVGEELISAGESRAAFSRMMDSLATVSLLEPQGRRIPSSSATFQITVTTGMGLLHRQRSLGNQHVIRIAEVADDSAGLQVRPWIELSSTSDSPGDDKSGSTLLHQLKLQWKGACNVR